MGDDQNCVFCNIIDGTDDAEVLLEAERHLCFLDKYPVNEGHALVVPKDHAQRLDEANGSELYDFLEQAITEVRDRYEPDAVNVGLNDGSAAGQTIPHIHWHIIPRYDGDIEDPTGGVRGVIPEKRIY